jgi:predicted DNA-binding protein with PD1-like motif
MKSKLINKKPKTFAVIFDTGDEVMAGLKKFAREQRLSASHFTAIGAFSTAVIGFFNLAKREYKRIPISEQVEVLSLLGDAALVDGEPQLHAHVVLGKSDGTAHGGHLLEAQVRPTLEVILIESPRHLHRVHDAATGLQLIDINEEQERKTAARTKGSRTLKNPSRRDYRHWWSSDGGRTN